jgi:NADH:ubiquinone oxidoreductase subunit F (NADH-binding)
VSTGPPGYVTGEETAVISELGGQATVPSFTRPYERGYRGRRMLVQNPETLAQIALVARHGARWYRELGTDADPGSVLVTVSGAVRAPGVYELAFGTRFPDLLAAAGGATEPLRALLIGGYFGTWVDAGTASGLRLARADLATVGCTLGAGVLLALGESSCGLHQSARVAAYLAAESAGQCGPCVHGLRSIADAVGELAAGRGDRQTVDRLLRWTSEVRGRGACHHPDGAARFVDSAVRVFAAEIEQHRRGRCVAAGGGALLGARR